MRIMIEIFCEHEKCNAVTDLEFDVEPDPDEIVDVLEMQDWYAVPYLDTVQAFCPSHIPDEDEQVAS